MINSNKNKLEAQYAQLAKKRKNGETTINIDGEEVSIEKLLDPSIPGSIGDLVFNKDEMGLIDVPPPPDTSGKTTSEAMALNSEYHKKYGYGTKYKGKTGKRIPKEKEHKLFHHLETGENIRVGQREVVEKTGGTYYRCISIIFG